MKFLQIGLGSMGKRRIRNLLYHKIPAQDIFGFDLSKDRAQEVKEKYKVTTFTDFTQADNEVNPNAYIISTPPHLHAKYFLHAAKNKKHFFTEVATTNDGYDKLLKLLDNNFVAAPSCSYRFYEPIKQLQKLIENNKIGQIQAFTHHMGQYLPDWHPWENIKDFYVSKPESSACREMVPFELNWLQWVINDQVTLAKGFTETKLSLSIKTKDTYAATLKTKNNIIGTLLVDVISRAPFRTLRILGTEGVLEWHWQQYLIKIYSSPSQKWTEVKLDKGKKIKGYKTTTEEMYEDEIAAFLDAISGKKSFPYTFKEDNHNFFILKMIEDK